MRVVCSARARALWCACDAWWYVGWCGLPWRSIAFALRCVVRCCVAACDVAVCCGVLLRCAVCLHCGPSCRGVLCCAVSCRVVSCRVVSSRLESSRVVAWSARVQESYLCVAKSVHVAFVRLLRRLHASVCMRAPGWEPVPASACLCAQPLKVVRVLREHLCPCARMWQEVLCRHGVFERQIV